MSERRDEQKRTGQISSRAKNRADWHAKMAVAAAGVAQGSPRARAAGFFPRTQVAACQKEGNALRQVCLPPHPMFLPPKGRRNHAVARRTHDQPTLRMAAVEGPTFNPRSSRHPYFFFFFFFFPLLCFAFLFGWEYMLPFLNTGAPLQIIPSSSSECCEKHRFLSTLSIRTVMQCHLPD